MISNHYIILYPFSYSETYIFPPEDGFGQSYATFVYYVGWKCVVRHFFHARRYLSNRQYYLSHATDALEDRKYLS